MHIYQSETAKHREVLLAFCEGYGLDIGYGGDPITAHAIRMDFPQPYANTGSAPVQLGGDCRHLRWFNNGVLDFVYSSHVLEDFSQNETEPVMREWARVLKIGGQVALLVPDQQRYLRYCERTGHPYNDHHSIEQFSLDYLRRVAQRLGDLEETAAFPELGEYSFAVVFRKIHTVNASASHADAMEDKLEQAFRQCDELKLRLNRIQGHFGYRFFRGALRLLRGQKP